MRLVVAKLISNLPVIVLVLLLGGIVLYISIENVIEDNIDEILRIRKEYAINLIDSTRNEKDLRKHVFANIYHIRPTTRASQTTMREFTNDTLIYDRFRGEHLLYRQLSFVRCKGNICYQVTVRKALVDHHIILKTIFNSILIISLIMALAVVVLNVFINQRLLKPFYIILDKLSHFKLNRSDQYIKTLTQIVEFKQLDDTLSRIIERLQTEYAELKTFTSYLTHELQTPLAVIKAHTDVLLLDEKLSPEQVKSLVTIRNMTDNIVRFEEALIFLKRIELGEFNSTMQINFSGLLRQKLEQTEELIKLKKVQVKTDIEENIELNMHTQLMEALLNNIISNSIRHNHEHGNIYIALNTNYFLVQNTTIHKKEIKSEGADFISSRGLGVGLSIVKSICAKYNYKLQLGLQPENMFAVKVFF